MALRSSTGTYSKRYIVTALAVGLLLAADDAKKDKDLLQGSWRAVSAEQAGKAQPDVKEHLLTFEGDTFTIKRGDQLFVKGTFTLDPSKTPKVIDMKVTEGRREEDKGKEVHGIYELDKDTLKWCTAEPGGKDRPKAFATKEGTNHLFVTLKKEK
jgi:uncharacterized protein (TIGR03067 family)